MGLRFGGTGADRRPADQVLQVLRGNRVERFGGGGQAFLGKVAEQLAADVQAILDLERVVQVRIVDQAFPAHRGTRLLEVHAHHQEQRIRHFGRERLEAVGVFVGGLDVVDGAGADHHEQTVVLAIQDVAHHLATLGHGLQGLVGQGISRLSCSGVIRVSLEATLRSSICKSAIVVLNQVTGAGRREAPAKGRRHEVRKRGDEP